MPYIDKEDRKHIEEGIQDLASPEVMGYDLPRLQDIANILRDVPSEKVKGAFNYFVTRLWLNTFRAKGYTDKSDGLAVFRDMDAEIRRRDMDPYEDKCIEKNGDLPEWEPLVAPFPEVTPALLEHMRKNVDKLSDTEKRECGLA